MENSTSSKNINSQKTGFKMFAAKRVIVGILLMVVVIWVVGVVLGLFEKPSGMKVARKHDSETTQVSSKDKVSEVTHVSSKNKITKETSHEQLKKEGHETAESPIQPDMDTAGGIMTSDFIALDKDLTAQKAVEYLKKEHHDIKQPYRLFVVNDHKKLLGTVSLKQLMFASADTPLEDFMTTDVKSIKTSLGRDKVEKLIAKYHIQSVPIIDNNNRLVGVVKADDIVHPAPKETVKTVMHAPATAHKAAEEKPEHPSPVRHEEPEAEEKPEYPSPVLHEEPAAGGHTVPTHEEAPVAETKPRPKGVAFVEAAMKPLDFELSQRFWGWRPNDILNFTDNVNNFQLGVLEVTRRTAVILTERISRTGATAAFDRNLERAMNWFMIKSDRYWFPSPESKYKSGLQELKNYKEKLEKGEANFHTRTDNLIPLLMAYEDLLGGCEENLVKVKEAGQTPVSFFMADDYFYYAKGVVSAMGTILEAVLEDFMITVESRRGAEVLHHAIESCHHASEIDPWMITNSSLSGILANHRANLAAPMSHARFYIGVLIKTLST